MDCTAREGIAAHWRYKEGEQRADRKLDGQLQWLRQMYEWLQDAHAPEELIDSVRRDFTASDIYVFTPKGEVKELPVGATPLDFAYLIHSDVGNHCIGARANGRMVPLRYNLQTGDMVEILTSKSQTPHLDWVDVVVTGRARTRIRQRLRDLGKVEPLEDRPRQPVAQPSPAPKVQVRHVDDATREKLVRIEGAKDMAVQFAKCCDPMPGHGIIGYATRSPGITIHRVDCKSFVRTKRDPKRVIQAGWEGEEQFETGMRVAIQQRRISKAQFRAGEDGKSYFDFVFESPDQASIDRVARALRTVPGVSKVETLSVNQLVDG